MRLLAKRATGKAMKYWEIFFLTLGAGLLVGAVITPKSWIAIPTGLFCAFVGYALNYFQKEKL
ncbi:MAG: hypothetical protein K6G15_03795 [Desulfovibrio sp.]|nr:hypothetical protein [Desulfovibrio sp.]